MSKLTRVDFIRGAASSLSQQNFPWVYKNAIAALALGSTPATYYLCAYYRHQMQEIMKSGVPTGAVEAGTNFCIMYQLAEKFQIQGYTNFTYSYQDLFSKIQPAVKKAAREMVVEYTKYLQATQMKYSDGTVVDIRTAEHLASTMEQSVLQQAVKMHTPQPLEVSASHHHHQDEPHARLLGEHHEQHNEHKSKCCDCVIL